MSDCNCGFGASIPGFGTPGATFIPKVTETDEAVKLSWENNRGLPNPDPVLIPRGKDGLSAYEVAKANGFEGTEEEWLESLEGPVGPVGPQGKTGPVGPAGENGAAGAPGKSAYEYAKDGGYTGTEKEFAAKLAEEYPTPNWNAAEGENGHILNKPEGVGYTEYTEENSTVIFPETVVSWNAETEYMGIMELTAPLTTDGRYKVTYNGTEYITNPIDLNGDGSAIAIGNLSPFSDGITNFADTGEPFVIVYGDGMCFLYDTSLFGSETPTDGSATVSITKLGEIVHPIDPKYLEIAVPYYVKINNGVANVTPDELLSAYGSGRRIIYRSSLGYEFQLLLVENNWFYFMNPFGAFAGTPTLQFLVLKESSGSLIATSKRFSLTEYTG